MALVNKNGQTPTQVRQEDDLRQQLEKVWKQQGQLQRQQEQLQKQLDTLQQKGNYAVDKIATVEGIVDTGFYYTQKEIRKSLWNVRDYLCIVVIILVVVQGICFWSLNGKVKDTLQAIYTINDILRGETVYWYNGENKALYIRDKENGSS